MTSSSCEYSDEFVIITSLGLVAQLVEQRTENPCVGGSIPPRATRNKKAQPFSWLGFCINNVQTQIQSW